MRSPDLTWFVTFILLACWAAPAFSLQEPPDASQTSSEAQTAALVRAFELISDGKLKKAKAEIDRAAAMTEKPCGECLLGLSHISAAEEKWNEAVDAAQRAIPLLKSPGLLARAYNQLGVANARLNTRDSLTRAESALRKGADTGGAWGEMARYNLAELLLRQAKWAEAAEAAQRYLQEAGPDGTALKEARVLLCRARGALPYEPSGEPGEDPEVKRVGGDVLRPEILFQTKPEYPEAARRARAQGTVIVEAIIDEAGCVRAVRVLEEVSHGLTESAVQAVRNWVFLPATLAGEPVKVYYVLTVNYSVSGTSF